MGRRTKEKICVKCEEIIFNRRPYAKYCKECSREIKTTFNKLRVRKSNAITRKDFNLVKELNEKIMILQKQLLIKNSMTQR